MGSTPEAIIAYLDSHDFESAIRNAVSIGGDSDTIGAMTGAIAQAAYEICQWHLLVTAMICWLPHIAILEAIHKKEQ